jgi:hypothetical protein
VITWVIHSIRVGQQGSKQTTAFQQLMPITTRSCEATHFNAEDHAYMSQRYLCNHALKSCPILDASTAQAKVIIDHFDAIIAPSHRSCAIYEPILHLGGFYVLFDLLRA